MHSVVTVEGAEETPQEEMERRALELAAERGYDRSSLETLNVDPQELESGARYRVDPASRSLWQEVRSRAE